jgi:hypothetical protein
MPRRCTRCSRSADDSLKPFCRYCGGALEEGIGQEVVLPPPIEVAAPAMASAVPGFSASGQQNVRSGIGGWLLLPVIGFIISPFRLLYLALIDTLPFIGTEDYRALVDVEPLFGPLLWTEMLVNLAFAIFSVVVLVALFGKRRTAPRLAITFYALMFAFIAVDLLVAANLDALKELAGDGFWKDSVKDVVRAGTTLVVWGSYFNSSKRVEATFVND